MNRVTYRVDGLERFLAFQWKVLGCDHPGCEKWFGGGYKYENALRADAPKSGWQCDETGDFCPDHAAKGDTNG